ncbi:MAG: trypsin-like peptidase domain-containing protein [Kiritimatiellales bacterium]|nr:trypsin-like peptidase domain-containing protein [Kiritimatiellales bacterium]
MDRKWTMVILFCSLMVFSTLISRPWRADNGRTGRNFSIEKYAPIPEAGFSPRQLPVEGNNAARLLGSSIADAVERVMPSVVVIRTEAIEVKVKKDIFGFFYRVQKALAGEGSGVIIDTEGHILTSHHVVKDARQIEVVLNDGTKLPAEQIGCDEVTDVAVLQIRAKDIEYQPVQFGDSDKVRVGEVAIAIGSPFSLQSSVTVGFVSQKGRRVQLLPYEDFIQTDAAINPGNSGGPLIDVDGRLIGINTAIQAPDSDNAGNVGIAFAIPSNLAMVITRSLIEKGSHQWPWVGASFGEIDPQLRKKFFGGNGVPVEEVWRDTPAAQVGMLPGDIILEVKGVPVKTEYDIYRIIFNHSVGDRLPFLVQRNEKQLEFELLLQALPAQWNP